MPADQNKVAGVHGAPADMITTVEAVLIKADGRRVDYGVVASSDESKVPLSARPEEE